MAAQTIPVPQEAAILDIVAMIPPPPGVRLKRVFFNMDHSGEPAIRVIFGVAKKFDLTEARVHELGEFQRAVRDAILEKGFDSFPYVTFGDAR